jgi:hypothetical protein
MIQSREYVKRTRLFMAQVPSRRIWLSTAHGVFFKDFEKLFPADNQNVSITAMIVPITAPC